MSPNLLSLQWLLLVHQTSSLPTYFKVISSHFWLQMTTYMLMIGFKVITLSSELQTPSSRTSTTDLTEEIPILTPHQKTKLCPQAFSGKGTIIHPAAHTKIVRVILNFLPSSLTMNLSGSPGLPPCKTDLHSTISHHPYC